MSKLKNQPVSLLPGAITFVGDITKATDGEIRRIIDNILTNKSLVLNYEGFLKFFRAELEHRQKGKGQMAHHIDESWDWILEVAEIVNGHIILVPQHEGTTEDQSVVFYNLPLDGLKVGSRVRLDVIWYK